MPCCAQHQAVVLEVLPDLEDGRVFQQRLEHRQRLADRHLLEVALAEVEAAAADAMPERHVAGPARRHGHREADELGLHRIEAGRLRVEGEAAGGAGLGDPGLQLRQLRHRLVLRAVDLCALAALRQAGRPPAAWRRTRRRPRLRRWASPAPAPCFRHAGARRRPRLRAARLAAAPRRPTLRRCAWSASRIPSRAGIPAALRARDRARPAAPPARRRGTSCLSVTRSSDSRACMANSISRSRRLGCLISPARASSVSRSPYSLISSAAVLTPMPGTPGTLSVESPASACTSTTLSGGTPNFSRTSSGPMVLVLHGVEHRRRRA